MITENDKRKADKYTRNEYLTSVINYFIPVKKLVKKIV